MAVVPRHTHAFTDIVGGAGTGGSSGGDLAAERAQRIAADAALEAAKVNRVGDDRVTGQLRVGQSKVDDQSGTGERVVLAQVDGTQRAEVKATWVPGDPETIIAGGGSVFNAVTATLSGGTWYPIAYGNGVFIRATGTGLDQCARSTDGGLTWTNIRISSTVTSSVIGLAYGDGRWIATVGDYANPLYVSDDDGLTWTSSSSIGSVYPGHIAYGGGTWVVVDRSYAYRSTNNGASWLSVALPRQIDPIITNGGMGFGNGLFTLSTTRLDASGYDIYTSPDGQVWTSRYSSTVNSLYGACYGGGVWIVGGRRIIRSVDNGLTWADISVAGYPFTSVSYLGGVWVATAAGVSGIIRSTDGGLTWASLSAPGAYVFLAAGLAGSTGRFVSSGAGTIAGFSNDVVIAGTDDSLALLADAGFRVTDHAGSGQRLQTALADGTLTPIPRTAHNPAVPPVPGTLDFGPLYGIRLLDEAGATPAAAFVQNNGLVQANRNVTFEAGAAATTPYAVISCSGTLADVMGHMTVTATPSLAADYWHYATPAWGESVGGGWLICDANIAGPPPALPTREVTGSYGATLSTDTGSSISVKLYVKPITTGGQIAFTASYVFGIFKIEVTASQIQVYDGSYSTLLWSTALPAAGSTGRYLTIAYAKSGSQYALYVDGVLVNLSSPGTRTGVAFSAIFLQDSDPGTSQYGAHGFCELVIWTSAPNAAALRAAREREYRTGVTIDTIDTLALARRTNLRIPDLAGTPVDTPQSRFVRVNTSGDLEAATGEIEFADGLAVADGSFIYLRGDASTDGSVRFSSPSAGTMLIEKRDSGSWVSIGSFA